MKHSSVFECGTSRRVIDTILSNFYKEYKTPNIIVDKLIGIYKEMMMTSYIF